MVASSCEWMNRVNEVAFENKKWPSSGRYSSVMVVVVRA